MTLFWLILTHCASFVAGFLFAFALIRAAIRHERAREQAEAVQAATVTPFAPRKAIRKIDDTAALMAEVDAVVRRADGQP